ncbi:MAG: GntR family transcriptional regulator [Sphingobacteriales bacterium]|nr:MAG: GntR family transcriptional regulator [Sphingobacteriales bacterium]
MRKDLLSLININHNSAVPVYRQIVHSIRQCIDHGQLVLQDPLPSVNSIAEQFGLARGSVFSAYNELRASGIIDSVPGKGYFVTSTITRQALKLFLLLDDFTTERSLLYQCIREVMPEETEICVFFHHDDPDQFRTLIREKASYHNAYIIIPASDVTSTAVLSTFDHKKLVVLSGNFSTYHHTFGGINALIANNLAELPALLSKQFL